MTNSIEIIEILDSEEEKEEEQPHLEPGSPSTTKLTTTIELVPPEVNNNNLNDTDAEETIQPAINYLPKSNDKSKPFKIVHLNCPVKNCPTKLTSLAQLRNHQKDVHGALPFQCYATKCGKQFKQILPHSPDDHHHQIVPQIIFNNNRDSSKEQPVELIQEQLGYCENEPLRDDMDSEITSAEQPDVQEGSASHNAPEPNYRIPQYSVEPAELYQKADFLQNSDSETETASETGSCDQIPHLELQNEDSNGSESSGTNLDHSVPSTFDDDIILVEVIPKYEPVVEEVSLINTVWVNCTTPGCTETCGSVPELRKHLVEEHRISPYRCFSASTCTGKSFEDTISLEEHLEEFHPNVHSWICPNCPTTTALLSNKSLADHLEQYHLFGFYKCNVPECPFVAIYQIEVYQHQLKNHLRIDADNSSLEQAVEMREIPEPEVSLTEDQKMLLANYKKLIQTVESDDVFLRMLNLYQEDHQQTASTANNN